MNSSIEKVNKTYVLASIDNEGKTVYLRYLLNKNWEIVTDIEIASKMGDAAFAAEILDEYHYDTKCYDDKFVVVPLKVIWELIKEVDIDIDEN